MFKCEKCQKEFETDFDRIVHQRRCRPPTKVQEKLPSCKKCGDLCIGEYCFKCGQEFFRQKHLQTHSLVFSKYKSGKITYHKAINQIELVEKESGSLKFGICFGLVLDWLQKVTCAYEVSATYCFTQVWNSTSTAKSYQIVRDEVENAGKFYIPIVLTVSKLLDEKFDSKYKCIPLTQEYISFVDTVDECMAGEFVQLLSTQLVNELKLSEGTLICSLDSIHARHAIGVSFELRENSVLVYLFDPNSLFISVAVPCDSKNELQLSLAVGLNIVLDRMIGGYVTNGSIHRYHSIAAILFSYRN